MQTLLRFFLFVMCVNLIGALSNADDRPDLTKACLPRTEELHLDEPLDVVMVRGINRYAERELQNAKATRSATWLKHPVDSEQGLKDRQSARDSLKKIVGLPSTLTLSPTLARTGSDTVATHKTAPWADLGNCVVTTCQWDAFEGVTGRGLLAVPKVLPKDADAALPLVVVIPDVGQTPEACFGLESGSPSQGPLLAKSLAENGCLVLCPLLIDRDTQWSGHPDIRWTNLPHREFVYRLSFELGLHPVGYDVAKVLTGIQAVQADFAGHPLKTVAVGTGEGGLIALAAGAIDDQLIDAVYVRGYFDERDAVWKEPIYRNLYGQLLQFADAELASLIAPRPLVIENCAVRTFDGPENVSGRANVAAPGRIEPISPASLQREFAKAAEYYRQSGAESAMTFLSATASEAPNETTLAALNSILLQLIPQAQVQSVLSSTAPRLIPATSEFHAQRMKSQVEELERYSQRVLYQSHLVRKKLWKEINHKDVNSFAKSAEKYRELVHDSFIGKLPEASIPMNPRTRLVIDEPTHTGYEVVLDIHPSGPISDVSSGRDWGVIAGGILLVPKDLRPDERRPVVVFQHGLEGVPMDTITTDPSHREFAIYQAVSTNLVKRGFIVYAPQNPYRGFDEFRVIQRKSNPLGRSLFSYIVEQHRQTLNWLAGLSYVDPHRIAFYGLSYGGKTAMRVPPLLIPGENQAGYCLSICSADFNDWIRKNASGEDSYSYVFTKEYEIFEWNMGHIANYAELSALMLPRPFMVERGLDDGVGPDDWVASEYAKVRRPYVKLGIADHTEMEVFNGPHAINGIGTYEFLHHHLNWPTPEKRD